MVKSLLQGRWMRHPLHPILVHLPIGIWSASLIFDIIYLATREPTLAAASFYCMGLGIAGGLIAALPGLADYLSIVSNSRPKRIATAHMVLNLAVIGLYVVNFLTRRTDAFGAVPTSVSPGSFALSVLSVLVLGVSGYFGGLLVYQHGIGMRPEHKDEGEESRPRHVA